MQRKREDIYKNRNIFYVVKKCNYKVSLKDNYVLLYSDR